MAFDPVIAQRVRDLLSNQPGITEKKLFGGIGFLLRGNMACGVIGNELVVRVGTENYNQALKMRHTRPFDFGGRTSQGWVFVEAAGYESDNDLNDWVQRGVEFAEALPAKSI